MDAPFDGIAALAEAQQSFGIVQRKLMKSSQIDAAPAEDRAAFAAEIAERKKALRGLGYGVALNEMDGPSIVNARMAVIEKTDKGAAIYSAHPSGAIPESDWLSVGSIVEEVDKLLQPFATEIPVLVRDSLADAGIRADDGEVASGSVYNGRIHLFRNGLTDRAAVQRTLWHELLHFGLRHFMTEAQYIAKMGDLYMKDGWIRAKANAWMQTQEAKKLAETKKSSYVRARAVDEALAGLAEIIQTEPTGYQNNAKLAQAKRAGERGLAMREACQARR